MALTDYAGFLLENKTSPGYELLCFESGWCDRCGARGNCADLQIGLLSKKFLENDGRCCFGPTSTKLDRKNRK